MHQPKHIYTAGFITGILCGLLSALTVFASMQYIASQDLEKSNPFITIALISIIVGGLIGLGVSFFVHQYSKNS